MEHVFVSTRHNGKPSVTLHNIELAATMGEPINFDIYGHVARYVPERTCKRIGTKYREKLCQIEWVCGECGFPLYSDHDSFCPNCGAQVVGD